MSRSPQDNAASVVQATGNRCGTEDIPKNTSKSKQKKSGNVDFFSVNPVFTNSHSSQGESQLYIFKDDEAVFKMIIKGRSPTMRHVSRTHRVALDWLFDRVNFGPKIQVKYVDTKNQLADMLTRGGFTRDEWNHLLHLLNIKNSRHFFRTHFFLSNRKESVMSKRTQEGLSDDSPMVKAKSRSMNLVSHRNLSIARQNLQENTSDSRIPGSDRMDHVSAVYRKPLRSSTDDSPSLRSQERSTGNTSQVGSEHPE